MLHIIHNGQQLVILTKYKMDLLAHLDGQKFIEMLDVDDW